MIRKQKLVRLISIRCLTECGGKAGLRGEGRGRGREGREGEGKPFPPLSPQPPLPRPIPLTRHYPPPPLFPPNPCGTGMTHLKWPYGMWEQSGTERKGREGKGKVNCSHSYPPLHRPIPLTLHYPLPPPPLSPKPLWHWDDTFEMACQNRKWISAAHQNAPNIPIVGPVTCQC